MNNEINITLESNSSVINKALAIYNENDFSLLEDTDSLINITSESDKGNFINQKQISYILFNGKKIKGDFLEKKTIFAVDLSCYSRSLNLASSLKNFSINDKTYPVNIVDNLYPCDLLYAKGGIFDANELHSAVFLPYFSDSAYDNSEKHTYIFVNLMYERHKRIAARICKGLGFKVTLNGEDFDIGVINRHDVALWIVLHEYMHNSGPLPLLSPNVNKFEKKNYGFIEEMRVDLTTFKSLFDAFKSKVLSPKCIRVVVLILLERVFRASLYNYNRSCHDNFMYSKEVEGDVAICLLNMLVDMEILDLERRSLNIEASHFCAAINGVLSDIYEYEDKAYRQKKFETSHYLFSQFLRKKHFGFSESVKRFLMKNSVQNCTYELNFQGE